jgi:hypothetical protein
MEDTELDAYAMKFEFASKSYQFRCGDQSDWYDHMKVVDAVNAALGDAGVTRRFIELEPNGQFPVLPVRHTCVCSRSPEQRVASAAYTAESLLTNTFAGPSCRP